MTRTSDHLRIPRSHLRILLDRAAEHKVEMSKLLQELEGSATGVSSGKPGEWRHDPKRWLSQRNQSID